MTEQIFTQALLMAGSLEQQQEQLLRTFCRGAQRSLASKMKENLKPEDCKADFIAAASLFALAALAESDLLGQAEQVSVGDITLRRTNRNAAVNCLRNQAELMIGPYLKDRFAFLGV